MCRAPKLCYLAECALYEEDDYSDAARTLQQGLEWREEHGEGPDHFLLRAMGVYLSHQGDQDAAVRPSTTSPRPSE